MPYPRLFNPLQIGNLRLKNRIAMAPMEAHLSAADGSVSEGNIAYYRERALGGAGLIIVEYTCVDGIDGSSTGVPQLRLDHDRFKVGHARLAAAIHDAGAKVVVQLSHAGRQTRADIIGTQPVSSSSTPLKNPTFPDAPRALKDHEIRRIIASFSAAARRAIAAGYDGVMLHGAHGYLLQQFLSPLCNVRNDQWGGDFERRMRFPIEVIKAVKAELADKPLMYRMSVLDGLEGGLTIEDSEKIAPHLCDAGVDALDISLGSMDRADIILEPMSIEEGVRLPFARRIRNATGKPVITAGVMRWPEKCESALIAGDTDMISLGRSLLADPMWPNKARAGLVEQIRPCTSCNWCIKELQKGRQVSCAENPRCGRETEPGITNFAKGRCAVVVGAGPGGMVAALLLDQAGFEVTLYEKRHRLGGNLITSAVPPGKDKLFWYHEFLLRRIEQSNVRVRLGVTADKDMLNRDRPDAVVLAGGARLAPLYLANWGNLPTAPAYQALIGEFSVPPSSADFPVVIYGGGETGAETAEHLAKQGHHVLLVTRSDAMFLARNAEALYRIGLLQRLKTNPAIRVVDNTELCEINGKHITLTQDGMRLEQPAAAVLLAHGLVPDTELADALLDVDWPIFSIGDAAEVARIGEAVRDAYRMVQDLSRLIAQPEPVAC